MNTRVCKRSRVAALLAATLVCGVCSASAEAHPHIWIRGKATLEFEAGKVAAIRHEWTFDDFFSNALIEDFDKNRDKKLDGDEIKAMHDNAFVSLKDFGYFTHARAGGKPITIEKTKDFSAEIGRDGKVVYRFLALLPQPVDPRSTTFDASVHDHTYYVDVALDPVTSVSLNGEGSAGCKPQPSEESGSPQPFAGTFAQRFAIRCGGD
jgi:tRNA threonylcarbamoyladenosine biosynthesis protein TsaE